MLARYHRSSVLLRSRDFDRLAQPCGLRLLKSRLRPPTYTRRTMRPTTCIAESPSLVHPRNDALRQHLLTMPKRKRSNPADVHVAETATAATPNIEQGEQDTPQQKQTPPVWSGIAPHRKSPHRIDRYLAAARNADGVSRSKIKAWIKSGFVDVDGKPCLDADRLLHGGERVAVKNVLRPPTSLIGEDADLALLYQDHDLIVLNKPAGLTVHPAPGLTNGTLAHRLVHHFPELAHLDPERPGVVHRIDKDTSGLLLVARNESSRLKLADAFAGRRIHKEYLALVYGVPSSPTGVIELPIGRDPTFKTKMAVVAKGGRPALTSYQTLYADPNARFSLLRIRIHTGRTHQIRVHIQHIGHGIIGDSVYPAPAKLIAAAKEHAPLLPCIAKRQLLHAWFLQFSHPMRADAPMLQFICPPPKDFLRVFLLLQRRLQRVIVTGMPGCGKSSLLLRAQESKTPVFSADAAVASLYELGADGWTYIVRRFGDRFLSTSEAPTRPEPTQYAYLRPDPIFEHAAPKPPDLADQPDQPDAQDTARGPDEKPEKESNGAPNLKLTPGAQGKRVLTPQTSRFSTRPSHGRGEQRAIDKRAIFNAMRDSEPLRREIMDAIHPMVRHALASFWDAQRLQRVAIAEIPLALEADQGAWRVGMADLLAGVFCPRAERQLRLAVSRGWSADMFATMESWQWPEADKMRACDLIVDNSGPFTPPMGADAATTAAWSAPLTRQTTHLLDALRFLRRRRMRRLAAFFSRLIADAQP